MILLETVEAMTNQRKRASPDARQDPQVEEEGMMVKTIVVRDYCKIILLFFKCDNFFFLFMMIESEDEDFQPGVESEVEEEYDEDAGVDPDEVFASDDERVDVSTLPPLFLSCILSHFLLLFAIIEIEQT
jgi:hypothetical protein